MECRQDWRLRRIGELAWVGGQGEAVGTEDHLSIAENNHGGANDHHSRVDGTNDPHGGTENHHSRADGAVDHHGEADAHQGEADRHEVHQG